MRSVLRILILLSFVVGALACVKRNNLPTRIEFVDAIASAPDQRATAQAPFTASFNDIDYEVVPRYDYELVGLVVSYRHHDGNSRLHRLSNDHLNALDVCVAWGDTAKTPWLSEIKFWNGIFTCNFSTSDQTAWAAISPSEISNNHLISNDLAIRKAMSALRIGDQIRIRGQLADYAAPGQSPRTSSITRDDSGNGACETIFIRSFERLRSASSIWRWLIWLAIGVGMMAMGVLYFLPYQSRARVALR